MNFSRTSFLAAASTLIAIALPAVALAQGATEQRLLHPSADSWPGYHGDYSGRRHSVLTQITPQNVKNLSLAWAFQTEQGAAIKSSPLLVDGILYFTVPDHIWALDARSGHQIWHYNQPTKEGEHIGNRGVAMYKGFLFFRLQMPTWCRSMQIMELCAGRSRSRMSAKVIGQVWRPLSSGTTCSSVSPEILIT